MSKPALMTEPPVPIAAGTGLATAAVGVPAKFNNPVPNVIATVKASTMPVPMAARLPKPPSLAAFSASRRSQQHHGGRQAGHLPSAWLVTILEAARAINAFRGIRRDRPIFAYLS